MVHSKLHNKIYIYTIIYDSIVIIIWWCPYRLIRSLSNDCQVISFRPHTRTRTRTHIRTMAMLYDIVRALKGSLHRTPYTLLLHRNTFKCVGMYVGMCVGMCVGTCVVACTSVC